MIFITWIKWNEDFHRDIFSCKDIFNNKGKIEKVIMKGIFVVIGKEGKCKMHESRRRLKLLEQAKIVMDQ